MYQLAEGNIKNLNKYVFHSKREKTCHSINRARRSRDRMVVGFATTHAISAYHH